MKFQHVISKAYNQRLEIQSQVVEGISDEVICNCLSVEMPLVVITTTTFTTTKPVYYDTPITSVGRTRL